MATLPTRTTASFDAIKPVSSLVLLDDELNDIKGATGFLNGGTTGKKLLIKTSDATDPPVDCDQLGAGPLARFKLNGVTKTLIDNGGNIAILNANPAINFDDTVGIDAKIDLDASVLRFGTSVANQFTLDLATGIVTFTQQPIFPAAKTWWSITWFYANLPGAVESVESVGRFIVPQTNGIVTVRDCVVTWAGGADSLASNVFTIKRRNGAGTLQADLGTVEVNGATQNVPFQAFTSSQALSDADQIYPLFTTRNTASEQLVSITLRGTQTFGSN